MKRWIVIAAVALLTGVAAIFLVTDRPDVLGAFGITDMDVTDIVAALEAGTEDRTRFNASIDGDALHLTADGETASIALPEGRFYLSVAPYLTSTHECFTHNLVSCRGELVNATFSITVRDADGAVVLSGDFTSGANGFVGLWLPAGLDGTITVGHEGHVATGAFQTQPASATCMTTLVLS
ncbi:MAG: CueP family metal-binding protein [Bacillota bacterium]|nr:CueP family metal-binding protein [Bacillota bacterium]